MARLIIYSGAGLSAESGLATFRCKGGLWDQYDPMEVCHMDAFERNYDKVHEFYDKLRLAIGAAQPNAAHQAIAAASKRVDVVNVTTNIDDLLERAGCDEVMHIHGKVTEVIAGYRLGPDRYGPRQGTRMEVGHVALSPAFLAAHDVVKPGVIFFGEHAPLYMKLDILFAERQPEDVVIVVGSSEKVVSFVSGAYWGGQLDEERPDNFHFVNTEHNPFLPGGVSQHTQTAVEFFSGPVFESIVTRLASSG